MTANVQRRKQLLSALSHGPHVYGVHISNPGGSELFNTPGVATWKGHFHICNLCITFPLGFVEQRGKEPHGNVYSVPSNTRKRGAPGPQGPGRSGETASSQAQCRRASWCLSANVQAAGRSQDRFSPGQGQHHSSQIEITLTVRTMNRTSFSRGCAGTRRDLCQISSPCQGFQVFLCVRAEN